VKATKTKTAKLLPKTANQITNGGIYSQRVRCGKSTCKCSRGALHTGYYFFTRLNGKLIKLYIRKADLIEFSSLVDEAKARRTKGRNIVRKNLEMLKGLRLELREKQSLINSGQT
jgi:hypothetical protein